MGIAGGVFLAWAIGRELDPDDTTSAALATIVVLPLMALGRPSLGSSAAALVGVRIAVRTTGLSPQRIDGFALAAAAAYLGTQPEAWPGVAVMIVAMGVDRFVHPRGPERTLWVGTVMALVALIGAIAFSAPASWVPPTGREWVALAVITVAAALAVLSTRIPDSRGDVLDEAVDQQRLRLGRFLTLLALVVGTIYPGGPVTASLSPLWAAVVSVTMVFYARTALYRGRPSATERARDGPKSADDER